MYIGIQPTSRIMSISWSLNSRLGTYENKFPLTLFPMGGAIWPPLGYIAGKLKIDPGRRPGLLGLLILFSFGCFWRFLWNFHVPVRIYAGFVRPG